MVIDLSRLRADFPILRSEQSPPVYLDNAATTQKPLAVIERIQEFYTSECANIHRGVYTLSERATLVYEAVRKKVARFIHAADPSEIVFVRGTTEALNLLAYTLGEIQINQGDEILISEMEHHSNIVPWKRLAERKRAVLKVIPFNDNGDIDLDRYSHLITERCKLLALVHISNSLGTINPVKQMIALAHGYGIPVVVDGAQAAAHIPVDVQDLGCDFYAFSAHKLYGPTGIGVLYGKREWLDRMPPFHGGGDMIRSVSFENITYQDAPYKFEAGTPNIADTIAFGTALDYILSIGFSDIVAHEQQLLAYAQHILEDIAGVRLIGTASKKAGIISFVMSGVHPHDIGTILSKEGIAIRTGHHCTQPVMAHFGIPATARVSFAIYNVLDEIDALRRGLAKVREIFP